MQIPRRHLTLTRVDARAVTITVAGIGPLGDHGPSSRTRPSGAGLPGHVTGITILRRAKTYVIQWHQAPRSSDYIVRITIGRHQTAGTVAIPAVTVTGVAAGTPVVASIAGVSADHRVGPVTLRRLVPPR